MRTWLLESAWPMPSSPSSVPDACILQHGWPLKVPPPPTPRQFSIPSVIYFYRHHISFSVWFDANSVHCFALNHAVSCPHSELKQTLQPIYSYSFQPCRRNPRTSIDDQQICGALRCCCGSWSPERCPLLTSRTWRSAWRWVRMEIFIYFGLILKLYLSSPPRSCSGGPGRSASHDPSWDFTSYL